MGGKESTTNSFPLGGKKYTTKLFPIIFSQEKLSGSLIRSGEFANHDYRKWLLRLLEFAINSYCITLAPQPNSWGNSRRYFQERKQQLTMLLHRYSLLEPAKAPHHTDADITFAISRKSIIDIRKIVKWNITNNHFLN